MSKKAIGFYTATSLVIANMIGTGVFTSLGFQAMNIQSVLALILLWVVGGIIALCGALSYGELGAAMPRSGGEYHYLSKIYHPIIGFLSGWVSATVGFAAPVALSAMALATYSTKVFPMHFNSQSDSLPWEKLYPVIIASSVVVLITIIHSTTIKAGRRFQNIFTALKLLLILLFIVLGFFIETPQAITLMPQSNLLNSALDWKVIFSSAFAVSLVYVSYAYSGWNASSYIAGEIENPQRNLPKSLFWGTLIVLALYVLLNYIFLYTTPIPELSGQLEIGYIAASRILGQGGGKIMGLVIALLLVSSVSSMIMAGPRVSQVMGEDIKTLKFLSVKNKNGIPVIAIIVQSCITLLLIFTSSFEKVLTYVGFTLNLFTFLTVLGLFILRIKKPEIPRPYKTWGYPVTPVIFLLLSGWTLFFLLKEKTMESLYGLGTVGIGLIFYFVNSRFKRM